MRTRPRGVRWQDLKRYVNDQDLGPNRPAYSCARLRGHSADQITRQAGAFVCRRVRPIKILGRRNWPTFDPGAQCEPPVGLVRLVCPHWLPAQEMAHQVGERLSRASAQGSHMLALAAGDKSLPDRLTHHRAQRLGRRLGAAIILTGRTMSPAERAPTGAWWPSGVGTFEWPLYILLAGPG